MIDWLSIYSGYFVLLGFFLAFLGIAFWIYLPSNKKRFESYLDIPFREKK